MAAANARSRKESSGKPTSARSGRRRFSVAIRRRVGRTLLTEAVPFLDRLADSLAFLFGSPHDILLPNREPSVIRVRFPVVAQRGRFDSALIPCDDNALNLRRPRRRW